MMEYNIIIKKTTERDDINRALKTKQCSGFCSQYEAVYAKV